MRITLWIVVFGLLACTIWPFLMNSDHPSEPQQDDPSVAPEILRKAPRDSIPTPAETSGPVADVAPTPAAEKLAGALPIQILDQATGLPVAGAVVLVVAPHEYHKHRLFRSFVRRDPEVMARRLGKAYLTDPDGRIRVPKMKQAFCVSARHGQLWAFRRFSEEEVERPPLRVRLKPEKNLYIQVVDETGKPCAGVPVALKDFGQIRTRFWDGITTGPEGLARVSHIAWRLGEAESWKTFAATFNFPTVKPVELKLSEGAIPDRPVRLVLPQTGRVRVRLKGPGAREGATVGLGTGGWSSADPNPEIHSVAGESIFPHVGIGLRLSVDVEPMNREYREIFRHSFPGPAGAREETVVQLILDRKYPILVGRAVNLNGEPVRTRYLRCSFHERNGLFSFGVPTDEKGRFRLILRSDGVWMEERSLELEVDEAAGLPGVARAVVDLSRRLPPGENPLGDVVLRSGGHLLSGRVVDSEGRPVQGGKILVYRGAKPDPDARRPTRYGRAPVVASDDPDWWPPSYDWSPELDLFYVHTAADGTFSLHAICPQGPLRIWVGKEGYFSEMSRSIRRGASGEVFVLEPEASLAGSIRLGRDVQPEALDVRVVGVPAAVRFFTNPVTWDSPDPPPMESATLDLSDLLRPFREARRSESGPANTHEFPFLIEGLRPGRCSVEVRLDTQPEPVRVVHGIQILKGERNAPPRLGAIDLTGQLRRVGITVVDPDGRLPPRAEIREFRGTGRQDADYTFVKRALSRGRVRKAGDPVEPGPVHFLVDRESRLDVEIHAPDFRLVRLEDVQRDHRIVLRPGIRIRLLFPDGVSAPDDRHLYVYLERVRLTKRRHFRFPSDSRPLYWGNTLINKISCRVPVPGRYRVTVFTFRGRKKWANHEFDVRDDSGEQTFFVPVRAPEAGAFGKK